MEEAQRAGLPVDDEEKAHPEPKTVPELLDRGLTLLNQKEYNRAIDSFYVTRGGSKLTNPSDVDALRAQLAAAVPAPAVEG